MPLNKDKIRKILIISLSNIGDVILTFPVIDIIKKEFPHADLSVVVGPKAHSLLDGNKNLGKVIIFDKHKPAFKNLEWVMALRKERFDLIVDLRNTAIALFLFPVHGTSVLPVKRNGIHMREKHLMRLKEVVDFSSEPKERSAIYLSQEDRRYAQDILKQNIGQDRYIVISPSAADKAKRWPREGYAHVCDHWAREHQLRIVFVGDNKQDKEVADSIIALMKERPVNLCGKISLIQLAEVLRSAFFVVGNDSAVMHLASYLDRPALTIFGPTDPVKYGPWSSNCHFLKKGDRSFVEYQKADWNSNPKESITAGDVIKAVTIKENGVQFNK